MGDIGAMGGNHVHELVRRQNVSGTAVFALCD